MKGQTKRLNLILTKWELEASEDKEIISMGDVNFNKLSWDKN